MTYYKSYAWSILVLCMVINRTELDTKKFYILELWI